MTRVSEKQLAARCDIYYSGIQTRIL